MPPRSVKMNRFIFGFQRRVWWPKWTPDSSSSFMETTGMRAPFSVRLRFAGGSRVEAGLRARPPPTEVALPGRRNTERPEWYRPRLLVPSGQGREVRRELGRERRDGLDPPPGDRVREGELGGVQELPAKRRFRHPVHRIAHDGQVDRGQVDANLVHPPGLEPHPEERLA